MSQKNRTDLYEEFKNGDIPNENDFADTIDSALNLVEDGLVSYKVDTPTGVLKRFGIGGETAPDCPLGIKGEEGQDDQMISFTSFDESQKWNINLNPTGGNVTGFSIDDQTSGIGNSRFFIDQVSEGNVGIGTVEPNQKLHVQGANDGANVSIMVENLESGTDGGWLMSAIDDNVVPERERTFAIQEKIDTELIERMTFLTVGDPADPLSNVGINEILPYATLHVSRAASDPRQKINLAENTGILVLGPIDDQNLGMDSNQIQARTGEYIGPTLSFTATEMVLQPHGGGLTINGSLPLDNRVHVDEDGHVGIGQETTVEKLAINGAITVGDTGTPSPADGTIRFGGPLSDLEVWKDEQWNSLTTHAVTDGIWTDAGSGVIYYDGGPFGLPKVGIGTASPTAALHINEQNEEAGTSKSALLVNNQAQTSSTDPALSRIGLEVTSSGVWNENPNAINFGIYVSNVIGQVNVNSNIAAAFNGNTVIGGITGKSLIGESGKNVLAIQNGAAPNTVPGITPTTGIQIYSSNVTYSDGVDKSVFNLMNGDGEVIQLFRQPDLEPASLTVPNSGDANTDALIENMRLRINQLEDTLKALGILTP